MKIRIKDSSIRLRLSQTDLKTLVEEHSITSFCAIDPNMEFKYSVLASSSIQDLSAQLLDNHMSIWIPLSFLNEWVETDRVGFSSIIKNGKGGLHILLEKDWQCLKPRVNEDETDLYVHPEKNG